MFDEDQKKILIGSFAKSLDVALEHAAKNGLDVKSVTIGYQLNTDRDPLCGMMIDTDTSPEEILAFPIHAAKCILELLGEKITGGTLDKLLENFSGTCN